MTMSRGLRRAVTGCAALALGLLASASASASTPAGASTVAGPAGGTSTAAASAAGRSGSPQSAVDRVADFYGAYTDVLYDSGRGPLADSLREHYLTAGLRRSLARWETVHHEDGVLRTKEVPTAWHVAYNDSGMGHCWTRTTLIWEDSEHRTRHTRLMVQSDLETMLISGIRSGG
ncbi:hypothetical protein GCM10010129_59570 [Streptomyces fumigatiscleroticus]|nr:hypothetical protein GCM10010129_59570 [Streptomyces fumigatiscleroticus]